MQTQSQPTAHHCPPLLETSVYHLLEPSHAPMTLWKSSAAVVVVSLTRLVFPTQSRDPGSGNQCTRRFVLLTVVALKVS